VGLDGLCSSQKIGFQMSNGAVTVRAGMRGSWLLSEQAKSSNGTKLQERWEVLMQLATEYPLESIQLSNLEQGKHALDACMLHVRRIHDLALSQDI
jgi:hypothetical protein